MFFLIRFFLKVKLSSEKKEREQGPEIWSCRKWVPALPALSLTVCLWTSHCTTLKLGFLSRGGGKHRLPPRAVTGRTWAFDVTAGSVDPGCLHRVGIY